MNNFSGDLKWIHDREGHAGKPYWPGGMSGVTLDPGVDLGHANELLVIRGFQNLMSDEQLQEALSLKGITGARAEQALHELNHLKSFRITRDSANEIFPQVAAPYWNGVVTRWPELIDAPASVQTAMLSLAYNRGFNNSKLEVLTEHITRNDWRKVGETIFAMQQDHSLEGIRLRRRLEGKLILDSLV